MKSAKIRSVLSLWMAFILLLPAFIKAGHHHETFIYSLADGKIIHETHEKCAVCNFEFSVFQAWDSKVVFEKNEITANFICLSVGFHFSDLSRYTFLLRAPPGFANIV